MKRLRSDRFDNSMPLAWTILAGNWTDGLGIQGPAPASTTTSASVVETLSPIHSELLTLCRTVIFHSWSRFHKWTNGTGRNHSQLQLRRESLFWPLPRPQTPTVRASQAWPVSFFTNCRDTFLIMILRGVVAEKEDGALSTFLGGTLSETQLPVREVAWSPAL